MRGRQVPTGDYPHGIRSDAHPLLLLAGREGRCLLLAGGALVCAWCLCAVGRRRPVLLLFFLKKTCGPYHNQNPNLVYPKLIEL